MLCKRWRRVPWCRCQFLQTGSDHWCHWRSQPAPGRCSGRCEWPLSYECPTAAANKYQDFARLDTDLKTNKQTTSVVFTKTHWKKSHLDCTVIAAGADELRPSPGRVAGVYEGGVALQTLDPLSCLTVPNSYSLVRARREEHAARHNTLSQHTQVKTPIHQRSAIWERFCSAGTVYAPAVCVVMQLHHSATVAFQSGKIITFSIDIPHHCKKKKYKKTNVNHGIKKHKSV